MNTLRVLVFLVAGLVSAPIAAAGPATEGRVVAVSDGDTVTLEDGAVVRLVGIQAPKLPLGRPGYPTWPLAEVAKAAAEALCLGQKVRLSYGGQEVDRYGRLLAQLTTTDGVWVQGKMLERGMARVYTFADNRARAAEMLALEGRARAARRGIWADPFYAIRHADDPARIPVDGFELVEGKVLAAATVKGRGFLNFGPDRHSDFTITMAPKSLKSFGGVDGYGGHVVRVRGWVERRDGPLIEATHPEQIERLD